MCAASVDDTLLTRFRREYRQLLGQLPSDQGEELASGRIGIAVSGGADSLALLLLAHAALPGQVEAATIDHGLRRESAAEAAFVAEVCADRGIPHRTLPVGPLATGQGVQAGARDARYRELRSWCMHRQIRLLATAHHADDQAETLLMRLARGAGIRGLQGIRPWQDLDRMVGSGASTGGGAPIGRRYLVRPLLRFTHAELVATIAAEGLCAIDDPSNRDLRYDRSAARALLERTEWLKPNRLAAVADYMAEADAALDWAMRDVWPAVVHKEAGRAAWLFTPGDLPSEIVRRIVAEILSRLSKDALQDHNAASGPELSRFIEGLTEARTLTLAGVLGQGGVTWRFGLAPPRSG